MLFLFLSALAGIFFARARVVSVPDLHGDLTQTLKVLSAAGLIDEGTHAWTGGNATLVQTGDIVDRGDDAKEIYELFFALADGSIGAGGRVVNLLGNHDLMNLQGDLRYVSRGDYEAFGGKDARRAAWSPDGWLGERVRRFPAALVAGGVLFAHAGPLPELLAERGIEGLNEKMELAVQGDAKPNRKELDKVLGDKGPLWTRLYSLGKTEDACAAVASVLKQVGASHMVLGHTVQDAVRGRCDGRIVLADTGMSKAYGGPASFIEHVNGRSWAVYPPDEQRHLVGPSPEIAPHETEKTELTASLRSGSGVLGQSFSDAAGAGTFCFVACFLLLSQRVLHRWARRRKDAEAP